MSISKRPAHRFTSLKKDDFVDLNPQRRHPGWVVGQIKELDKSSGQVYLTYDDGGTEGCQYYWAHLDDPQCIADLMSKSTQSQCKPRKCSKATQGAEDEPSFADEITETKKEEMHTFSVGDWIEVWDKVNKYWRPAVVLENDTIHIRVHYDGRSSVFDDTLLLSKHGDSIRPLGSGLEPDARELEIKKEMDAFTKALNEKDFELILIKGDGNCLYRCFAHEIYGDQNLHMKVRQECISYMLKCDLY
ncbi:OTU-like cysteine protease [Reticulomyxa filosa]|uniref:OTU-like cysteine protease n=1 Tax=Reticulomyxa filosa TaxID=46433 RepID=X6MH93_RETFI|nr:OTU-like cysteine protease [Reticulomyxa filosa]|eukprot:ETO12410.1 OTU-like cysteine protease [Reticulomyxa filosa]